MEQTGLLYRRADGLAGTLISLSLPQHIESEDHPKYSMIFPPTYAPSKLLVMLPNLLEPYMFAPQWELRMRRTEHSSDTCACILDSFHPVWRPYVAAVWRR